MSRACAIAILILAGCEPDCMETLRGRAQPIEAIDWPRWADVAPSAHLHVRAHGVVWDEATDAYHDALASGRCPDPIPPPPRSVARFEGDELVRDGLYAVTRSSPRVRVDANVPYARVALVLDAFRSSDHTEVELRQIQCRGSTCWAEGVRVELDPEHRVRATFVRLRDFEQSLLAPLRSPGEGASYPPDPPPEPPDGTLQLAVRETQTGWVISGSGGRLAPGCQTTTNDRVDSIGRAAGLDALAECLHRVKAEFPDETFVALVPLGSTEWRDVADQLERIRFDGDIELFPEVVLPAISPRNAPW